MPTGHDESVRPFQLPANSPSELFLSQYQLAANVPIFVTPGFGSASSGQLPPLQTGSTHYESTTNFYVTAAQSELSAVEQ
jgi:hypothetical protein